MGHEELSQRELRDRLRKMVIDAIKTDLDDLLLNEDELDHVYFVVSPGLDEVFAWVNIVESEIDKPAFDGWHLEYAESIDEAMRIVDYYFDLR